MRHLHGPALAAGVFLLLALTIVAYVPALNGGFVWDDDKYVTDNATLTAEDGLRRIWLDPASSPQYYPLVFTTFWLEQQAWGDSPRGYHAINILLHALAAMTLWFVLRKLHCRGAWVAAAIFAVHPVHVESVAWITERKNVRPVPSGVAHVATDSLYPEFHANRFGRKLRLRAAQFLGGHDATDFWEH